jgi:2-amino-4-hydroxy-6-hydroxymethyldihydropteridine diphosphokinase
MAARSTGPHPGRAYIGLGANLGDTAGHLRDAVLALGQLPGARLAGVSRLYVTRPVGVTDQPAFHNAVAVLDLRVTSDVARGAIGLLVSLKDIERSFGRQVRARWGPREIDLDLLVYGRHRLSLDRPPEGRSLQSKVDRSSAAHLLEVPHREAHERLFVLAPLADLAPGLVPPGWHETVATARARRRLAEGAGAVRPVAAWDAAASDWRPLTDADPDPGAG